MPSEVKIKIRLFQCRHCGAAIGLVRRGSDRLVRLSVFRKPMVIANPKNPDQMLLPADADTIAQQHAVGERARLFSVIDMNDGMVMCLHCGEMNSWAPSLEYFETLLRRWKSRMPKSSGKEVAVEKAG